MDIRIRDAVLITGWKITDEFAGRFQLIESCILCADPKITIMILVNLPHYISAKGIPVFIREIAGEG